MRRLKESFQCFTWLELLALAKPRRRLASNMTQFHSKPISNLRIYPCIFHVLVLTAANTKFLLCRFNRDMEPLLANIVTAVKKKLGKVRLPQWY